MKYYLSVLKNYSNFKGRARRSEYWYFTLFNGIMIILWATICGLLGQVKIANTMSYATLLPGIAVAVRRMHDVGKSGWYLLIPIYNIILCCTDGNRGSNEYGEDPKSNSQIS